MAQGGHQARGPGGRSCTAMSAPPRPVLDLQTGLWLLVLDLTDNVWLFVLDFMDN